MAEDIYNYSLKVPKNRLFNLYSGVSPGIKEAPVIANYLNGITDIAKTIGARLFLNEINGIGFSYSHTYSQPLDEALTKTANTGGKILELINQGKAIADGLSNSDRGGAGSSPSKVMSKYQNLPAYEETSRIKLPSTLSFTFAFGQEGKFSGQTEVVEPIINFVKIFAPQAGNKGMISQGPLPLSGEVLVGIATRMTKGLFDEKKEESGEDESPDDNKSLGLLDAAFKAASGFVNVFNQVIDDPAGPYKSGNRNAFCCASLGKLFIPPFAVKGVSWDFDFSQIDNKGYPYRGTVSLNDCESVKIATSQAIFGMQKRVKA